MAHGGFAYGSPDILWLSLILSTVNILNLGLGLSPSAQGHENNPRQKPNGIKHSYMNILPYHLLILHSTHILIIYYCIYYTNILMCSTFEQCGGTVTLRGQESQLLTHSKLNY